MRAAWEPVRTGAAAAARDTRLAASRAPALAVQTAASGLDGRLRQPAYEDVPRGQRRSVLSAHALDAGYAGASRP